MKDLYFTSFWMDMLKGYSYFPLWTESPEVLRSPVVNEENVSAHSAGVLLTFFN